MKQRLLALWLTLSLGTGLVTGGPTDGSPSDSARQHRFQFIPLPVIYYTPETKLAYGALGVALFRIGSHARTSNVDFAVIHTLNKQLVIEPTYTIFTNYERYLIKGTTLYTQFPEFYYGLGQNTPDSQKELVSYKSFRSFNRFLRQVKRGWFVGVQHQYFNTFDVKRGFDTLYPRTTLVGSLGSRTNGLGLASVVDTRDNIYYPIRGWYAEVSGLAYQPALGSQFTFTNYLVDVRHYRLLTPKTVLAVQAFVNLNTGEVPFKQAATIGGASLMRGYYNGRYRDNDAFILQTEVRQRLVGRLGGVVFGAVGDVAHNLRQFDLYDLKATGGAGLRFLLSRKENVNIRFDAAVGRNTHGFYVNIAEAF